MGNAAKGRPFALAALILACLGNSAAGESARGGSEPLAVGFQSGGSTWAVSVTRGPADFRFLSSEGGDVLEMKSAKASFGFQRKAKVDLAKYPILSWRWKADLLPAGGDCRDTRTYDQAAQLYVAFSATRAIGYAWDTSAPAGAAGDSLLAPPFMKVKLIILRSGTADVGGWIEERRDLRSDYLALYGEEMPRSKEVGLRIWISSHRTRTAAASSFADIAFERPPAFAGL
jgi:hypothetical protein